jgi:manganese/zinc/iron transport system permease protein
MVKVGVAEDHILLQQIRQELHGKKATQAHGSEDPSWLRLLARRRLQKKGFLTASGETLSASGREIARKKLRGHRLWEAFVEKMGIANDHSHFSADQAEHFINDQLLQQMDETLEHPNTDPHGKEIPR